MISVSILIVIVVGIILIAMLGRTIQTTDEPCAIQTTDEPCAMLSGILTEDNKESCAAWHDYYEKLYGPLKGEFDLGNLQWFYNDAPLGQFSPYESPWNLEEQQKDCIISFPDDRDWLDHHPEVVLSKAGHFRHKKRPVDGDFIEVIRTNRGEGADEDSQCWFYQATGSGIFIRNENVETREHESHLTELIKTLPEDQTANGDIEAFREMNGIKKLCTVSYNDEGIMTCT